MKRLALFLCLSSTLSFADSWSGVLVDSGCWLNEERNVNPDDTSAYVDRDRNLELSYCTPKAKTKSFILVRPDGTSLKLDSAGDARASDLVRTTGRKPIYRVAVTGNVTKNTIGVSSIMLAR